MAPSHTELFQRNAEYAPTHQPFPTIEEIAASGGGLPKTCIITCVDPRVLPEKILGLNFGETAIFRTVAGHPQPVLDHLLALDVLFQGLEDVIVLYHTDCGSLKFDTDVIKSELAKTDPTVEDEFDAAKTGAISTSLEEALRDDIKWFKDHPRVRSGLKESVQGYIFDIKSGKIEHIV